VAAAEETRGHQVPPLDGRYEVDDDRVEEAMSVATIVAPEDTLGEVAERLVANRARAAVVAEYGRVLGILTTSDLVRAAAARVSPSDARARLWMTAEPIAVAPGYSLSGAAAIMAQQGIAQLPIVEGDRVLGLLEPDDARARAVPARSGQRPTAR